MYDGILFHGETASMAVQRVFTEAIAECIRLEQDLEE